MNHARGCLRWSCLACTSCCCCDCLVSASVYDQDQVIGIHYAPELNSRTSSTSSENCFSSTSHAVPCRAATAGQLRNIEAISQVNESESSAALVSIALLSDPAADDPRSRRCLSRTKSKLYRKETRQVMHCRLTLDIGTARSTMQEALGGSSRLGSTAETQCVTWYPLARCTVSCSTIRECLMENVIGCWLELRSSKYTARTADPLDPLLRLAGVRTAPVCSAKAARTRTVSGASPEVNPR